MNLEAEMKIAIIASIKDSAGLTIANCFKSLCLKSLANLHEQGTFDGHSCYAGHFANCEVSLHYTNGDTVFLEHIDRKIYADLFIFASRHQSKAAVPTLSCHAPGNWAGADIGGKPSALCLAPALWLRQAYLAIVRNCLQGYEPIMEATHHGPFIEKPCFFIEIGSTEKEWNSIEAGNAVAKSLIEIFSNPGQNSINDVTINDVTVCIGIGGLHSCHDFNKAVQLHNIAVGHICPKYNLHALSKEMLQHAVNSTYPKAWFALLDWKGLGTEKQRIVSLCQELNLPIMRTDKLD